MSDDQLRRMGRILAGTAGHVDVRIDVDVFVAAAHALANLAAPAPARRLLPEVLDPSVVPAIANAVKDASARGRRDNPTEGNTHA